MAGRVGLLRFTLPYFFCINGEKMNFQAEGEMKRFIVKCLILLVPSSKFKFIAATNKLGKIFLYKKTKKQKIIYFKMHLSSLTTL